jgi:hypothetical protein
MKTDVSEDVVIYDMSETIRKLIKEANKDKYRPGCKSYELFDEDDADCCGVNQDKHHDVSRESIENYIWLIYKNAQMEQECLIPSMMYLQKILDSHHVSLASKLRIYSKNWKTIVGMSMLIAAKVWDDFHMDVASVVTIMYCMTLQRCNKLEILCLKMIDFDVSVKRVAFCDYEEDIKRNMSVRSAMSAGETNELCTSGEKHNPNVVVSPTLRSTCTDIDEPSGYSDYEMSGVDENGKHISKIASTRSWDSLKLKINKVQVVPPANSNSTQVQTSTPPLKGILSRISSAARTVIPFMRNSSVKIG